MHDIMRATEEVKLKMLIVSAFTFYGATSVAARIALLGPRLVGPVKK